LGSERLRQRDQDICVGRLQPAEGGECLGRELVRRERLGSYAWVDRDLGRRAQVAAGRRDQLVRSGLLRRRKRLVLRGGLDELPLEVAQARGGDLDGEGNRRAAGIAG